MALQRKSSATLQEDGEFSSLGRARHLMVVEALGKAASLHEADAALHLVSGRRHAEFGEALEQAPHA